jgi:hypothetical protein
MDRRHLRLLVVPLALALAFALATLLTDASSPLPGLVLGEEGLSLLSGPLELLLVLLEDELSLAL